MSHIQKRERGLPSIARARADRAQGKAQWGTRGGMVAALVVIGGLMAHKVVSDGDRKLAREGLLAKERAVAVTLGPEWFPLRDKLEAYVLAAAQNYAGDSVDARARRPEIRSLPGLYLRMRVADAKDVGSIRTMAADSRRDAFVACLLREPNEPGLGVDGGPDEQPWNLGRAYAATRILTDEWVGQVKSADDDLRLRVFLEQYDKALKTEIPLAIDLVKRAQLFLLVLDEDVPEAKLLSDGGQVTEEALQLEPHPARVFMYDLSAGREIARLRRVGEARVLPTGERMVTDPETRDAMQRQANNCALAGQVDEALRTPGTAAGP